MKIFNQFKILIIIYASTSCIQIRAVRPENLSCTDKQNNTKSEQLTAQQRPHIPQPANIPLNPNIILEMISRQEGIIKTAPFFRSPNRQKECLDIRLTNKINAAQQISYQIEQDLSIDFQLLKTAMYIAHSAHNLTLDEQRRYVKSQDPLNDAKILLQNHIQRLPTFLRQILESDNKQFIRLILNIVCADAISGSSLISSTHNYNEIQKALMARLEKKLEILTPTMNEIQKDGWNAVTSFLPINYDEKIYKSNTITEIIPGIYSNIYHLLYQQVECFNQTIGRFNENEMLTDFIIHPGAIFNDIQRFLNTDTLEAVALFQALINIFLIADHVKNFITLFGLAAIIKNK